MRTIRRYIILIVLNSLIAVASGQAVRNDSAGNKGFTEDEYYYTFVEATKLYVQNHYIQALNLYFECLKLRPNSAAVNYQISKIFLQAGDIDRARQYAEEAYQNDKRNKWYIRNLINIYRNAEDLNSAIGMLELLIGMEDNGVEYKYMVAGLYEMQGKYEKALTYLTEVENQLGVRKEIIIAKYRLFRISGEEEKAVKELKEAKKFFSDDYTILGMMAEYYRDLNKPDSARLYYDMIIPDYLNNLNVAVSYSEFLIQEGNKKTAEGIMINAISNNEISKEEKVSFLYQMLQDDKLFIRMQVISDTISKILLQAEPEDINVQSIYADIQFRNENFKETSRILKKIIIKDERNYVAWEQMLYVENILNHADSVIKYSKTASDLFRTRPLPYLYLGSGYFQKSEYQNAIEVLEYGVEFAVNIPVKVQYFNLIAECYHKLGIYDSSWSYYDKALKLDEENILINNNYAYYLAEENVELKKALKMSEKTIKSEPENPTYLDTYAWILFKMNRIRKARKVIEKAIEYGGNDDPDILDHYGEILFRLGKYKESVTIWNRILELDQERKEEISKKIIRARELVK